MRRGLQQDCAHSAEQASSLFEGEHSNGRFPCLRNSPFSITFFFSWLSLHPALCYCRTRCVITAYIPLTCMLPRFTTTLVFAESTPWSMGSLRSCLEDLPNSECRQR